jgi:hypothetical protein
MDHTFPPSRLNGYPVIRAQDHGNGYATVMVHLSDNGATPFAVVTWWPDLNTSWMWGNYCRDASDAESAWNEVEARNAKR